MENTNRIKIEEGQIRLAPWEGGTEITIGPVFSKGWHFYSFTLDGIASINEQAMKDSNIHDFPVILKG